MALINIFGSVFVVRREKRVLKVLFFSLFFYVLGIEYLLQGCYKMERMRNELFEARGTFLQ